MARDPIYRRRGFDAEIIELCMRWYISYRLSYRDLVELMADRGIAVSHTTIMRWVIESSCQQRQAGPSCSVDSARTHAALDVQRQLPAQTQDLGADGFC